MTILFTADWHIKLGQKNVPIEWAKERYNSFFHQIQSLEKEVDIHIIGGDIFDRMPTLEELQLFLNFISKCNIPTYIYDGNHEATKKGKTFLTILKEIIKKINLKVYIVDKPVKLSLTAGNYFSILPYCHLQNKKSWEMLDSTIPLFTHVRGEIVPHVVPEINLNKFDPFPIVFAGDLHSHSNCQRNIIYPGSPMTTTFHRNPVDTGYIIINNDFNWEWYPFKLPQLLRKTINSKEEMIPGDYDHIIYEIEGDLSDLASIENSDLLDKKIVKRQTEAALILDKDMTLEEELIEYLSYILEIPENKVTNIIKVYNDYS